MSSMMYAGHRRHFSSKTRSARLCCGNNYLKLNMNSRAGWQFGYSHYYGNNRTLYRSTQMRRGYLQVIHMLYASILIHGSPLRIRPNQHTVWFHPDN